MHGQEKGGPVDWLWLAGPPNQNPLVGEKNDYSGITASAKKKTYPTPKLFTSACEAGREVEIFPELVVNSIMADVICETDEVEA